MENVDYIIMYSNIKNVYIQIKEGKVIIKAPKKNIKKRITKNNRKEERLDK